MHCEIKFTKIQHLEPDRTLLLIITFILRVWKEDNQKVNKVLKIQKQIQHKLTYHIPKDHKKFRRNLSIVFS
jgi:hypothetical protein